MATYRCPDCKTLFMAQAGKAPECPKCRAIPPEDALVPPLDVACASCQKQLKISYAMAGKLVSCPGCRNFVQVPDPRGSAARPAAAPKKSIRDYGYALFALALIPLVFSLLGGRDDIEQRIELTRKQNPGVIEKWEASPQPTEEALFGALPSHRIAGAHLARDSMTHWMYALGSAALFLGLILLVFGPAFASPRQLVLVGAFTGTLGILFLLIVQFLAEWTQGYNLVGRSIVVIFFYIAKFIGFSYRAALDSDSGFFLSFLGFTCGVGFCEELVKALPLIWNYRTKATLDWRAACLWGLATGVGFGVSEGITYSSDFYNGLSTGGIYVVRFISCVALHAVWSASAGITLWRNQYRVQGEMSWYEWFAPLLRVLGVVMVLHGLYDTLLKKDSPALALVVALASFAWLAVQIEWMRRLESEEAGILRAS